MADAPPEVAALVGQRAAARAARDFAAADALRERIAALGWLVRDGAAGTEVTRAPAYPLLASLADLPDRSARPPARRAGVGLLVEGWPDDLRTCAAALLAHLPPDVGVVALDLGDRQGPGGAGAALHDLATAHPDRVEAFHLAPDAGPGVGWGAARAALLRADPSEVHVMLETSTVLEGDAVGPLLAALAADETVVAAGWQGVDVDVDDGWRSFRPAGPGEVDAVLGYLLALRRDAAVAAGVPDARARGYRNADLETCLALRAAGGRVVVPEARLPVRQGRHRGYADTDPAVRDREGRRTYDRLLQRFRGRQDILAPRRR